MWSFFKIAETPSPQIVTIETSLTKKELVHKISSESIKKMPIILLKQSPKFIGAMNDKEFQFDYTNTDSISYKVPFLCSVTIKGSFIEGNPVKVRLETTMEKRQMFLIRAMNRFLILWWILWTLLTSLIFPLILMDSDKFSPVYMLMPLGVILGVFCMNQLKKTPKRSIDCAQAYLTRFISA